MASTLGEPASQALAIPSAPVRRRCLSLLALATVLGAGACWGERMPSGMRLTSPAFGNGEPIPERYSCEGENVPPPLRWSRPPEGTRELALAVQDPDAPSGVFVHWLVVGIPVTTTSLDPGGLPPEATVLEGSSRNATYIGPCPPDGDDEHRYFFQVYALTDRPRLPEGDDPNDSVRALRRAATAGGGLVGTYKR
jgi:Raf kinase inhibitor-like YbhB/YbcL family protein